MSKVGSTAAVVKIGPDDEKKQVSEESSREREEKFNKMDWFMKNVDRESSEPQSLEEELARLQVLRSYLILDNEREFPFERLTALASRALDAPIALVSLVDLGRQWFMSNRGLGDARETPRSHAFCAHAILSKNDLFIINDATKDPRFMNNPLVTGAPHIRFYAGAPLIAPEGYKLGTFCIIDTKTRPNGLDLEEKQTLRELSALTVDILVARRKKRERDLEKNSQLIACSAHDLLTPLSAIELSLSLVKDDEPLLKKLDSKQTEGLTRACKCVEVLQQICTNVQSTFGERKSAFEHAFSQSKSEKLKIDELVQMLYTVLEPIPKNVPVEITVDKDVPQEIISDQSNIFRCAMNYLIVACARTQKGIIKMRLSVESLIENKKPSLVVKCEDTGPAIDVDVYEYLFKPVSSGVLSEGKADKSDEYRVSLELALFSVAGQMNVVGGEFGFRPRNQGQGENETGEEGAVFWFSIPFIESTLSKEKPEETTTPADENEQITHVDASKFHNDLMGGSETTLSKSQVVKRQKKALIVEDSMLVRKMLVRSLTKLGFACVEAENGMVGLAELKNDLFDITFCDFLMPVMDGLDCVAQYRSWEKTNRPWFSQRIVGISAHASDADAEKGREVGMDDFRPKPITFQVLSALFKEDAQIAASKRLDEIFVNSSSSDGADDDDDKNDVEPQSKRLKTGSNGKSTGGDRNCLIMSPPSMSTHIDFVQQAIKKYGWHSTTAHTDGDAWSLLKMRTWDMVLVDESLAHTIEDFREWESKKRSDRQGKMILMSSSVDQTGNNTYGGLVLPNGLDMVIGIPISLPTLKNIIRD